MPFGAIKINHKPFNPLTMNTTQLRIAYSLWRESECRYSFRDFYEQVKDVWDKFNQSTSLSDFTVKAFMEGSYFEHDGAYYDHDDWVVTLEGNLEWGEDSAWCDYFSQHTSEPNTVYIGRDSLTYSSKALGR
jgi:hypothetical protein